MCVKEIKFVFLMNYIFSLLDRTVPTHREIPLTSSHYRLCILTKQAFTIRCLWWGLSSPHLLLSNRPIVLLHLCTTLLLSEPGSGPLVVCFSATPGPGWMARRLHLCDSQQRVLPEANQGSKLRARSSLQSLCPDLHNSSKHPLSRKESRVRAGRVGGQGERERRAQSNEVCLQSGLLTEWLTPSFGHNGASHP